MTPKPDKASDDAELLDDVGELDESDLSLDKQLELEEARILAADEKRSGSKETDDSEKSKDKVDEDGSLSTRERELLELAETRAELRETQARLEALERERSAKPKEDDIPFDVGEIDDSVDAVRPALNRMGKAQLERTKAVEGKLDLVGGRLQARIDQLEALLVMQAMKVDKAQVPEIIDWARKNDKSYTNAEELEAIILAYRDAEELKQLRAEKAARAKKPEVNTRQRPVARDSGEKLDDLKGEDSFTRAWNRSVRQQLSELKSGRFH